ncbi:OmpL47-type beta-barrel domain-containing protein [Microbacterium sp. NPDC090007]|uniref:OmpL47-type beta-barrel domain-containing protein n=1 Tax=Microbacterium sp. NPDC090007 TaxID=3364204 RepID=UPI003827391F
MTPRRPLTTRRLLAAAAAAVLAGALASPLAAIAATGVPTDPGDGVPRVDPPVAYDRFQPLADPGRGAADYFQPRWFDTDGRHIQAHGGQVVTTQEDGQTVYYWYGEDRTKGYWNSPGVAVYRSTDAMNWTNLGDALRSISTRDDLLTPYFDDLYDTVDDDGRPRAEKIDQLAYHLNSTQESDYTAIFERPKVLHNEKTGKWVMWWHADGRTEPGGSTYARSMAAVAVSDSPAGPFRMTGAFRMPNRADYQACTPYAVPGQARDMTVFQDDDGRAYISYSSEENYSLYVAALDDSYTNVTHTTDRDTLDVKQYSEDGRYPYVFADGTPEAPVRGEDFQIVKECGHLEAPAIFERDGTYSVIASGATGWAPNPQTYYTTKNLMGGWIRGVETGDANETVSYDAIPDGGDGLLSIGDVRRSTFGSQSTNVLELEPGKFVYMGDRWNDGASDSTYVWLPLTVGENGRLEMHNPAAEDPARYGDGWDASYWDDKGFGHGTWKALTAGVPETVRRGTAPELPTSVPVDVDGTTTPVAVTWSAVDTRVLGPQTLTGTLAADAHFTAGRSFQRTITVVEPGIADIAPEATVTASSRNDLVGTIVDGNATAKGWDDWTGNGYPRDSWLEFDWGTDRTFDSIVVHTYKDGPTATWPSRVQAQYRDASGAWIDTEVAATLAQDATAPAPVAVIDARSLPAASALRLRLTSEANTWQSIAEVDVWGNASAPNVCRGGDATVSASFHQTKWATMPAGNACDGRLNTQWSTWTDAGYKDTSTFTLETSEIHRLNEVRFTNIEGAIAGVTAEFRAPSGEWRPVTTAGAAPTVVNGTETTMSFSTVLATGLRLTFATPGSYLKIPEIVVPEAGGIARITPQLTGEANAAGWYRDSVGVLLSHDGGDDVTVQHRTDDGDWTTGVEFEVSGDGAHTVDYRALWNGDEVAAVAGSIDIRIDTVAPRTRAETANAALLSRLMDPAAVREAPARSTVELTATDATSGVATTEYSVDAGTTWTTGTSLTIADAGDHTVQYRSTDVAGNVEQTRSIVVTVAATPGPQPEPTGSATPAPSTPAPSTPAPGASGAPVGSGAPAGSAGAPAASSGTRAPGGLAATGAAAPLALGATALLLTVAGGALLAVRRRRA